MSTQGEFFELPKATQQNDVETSDQDANASDEQTAKAFTASTTTSTPRRGLKDLSIPKLYYSISEVSRITGLEQYVLRYWETEFDELRPQKNRAGNRIYSNKDIKFILRIKELLREKRYTIEGAKQILKEQVATDRDNEKMDATISENGSTPAKASASDPSQITIDDTPKKPQIKIERSTIDEMRASVRTLKDLLRK
jgi:DNA-binding transcriptional MerR regulator